MVVNRLRFSFGLISFGSGMFGTTGLTTQAADSACRQKGARLHGLDSLRAMAILLVVAPHAANPYLTRSMLGLVWPARDSASSTLVDAVFWWIACFIVPVFFCMSGYLAAQLRETLGNAQFLRNRFRRIGLPLLLASVTILPFELYLWTLGLIGEYQARWKTLLTLKFYGPIDNQLWGFSHCWYLQYLLLYCVALSVWWSRSSWNQRERVA